MKQYQKIYYLNDGNIYNGDEYELKQMTGITLSITVQITVDQQLEECHGIHTILFEERDFVKGEMVRVSYDGEILQSVPMTKDQLRMIGEFICP